MDLTENGLTHPGQRHDGALKLVFYYGAVLGLPRDEVLARVEEWLQAFPHASNLAARSPVKFVRDTLLEAAHYYDQRVVHCCGRGSPRRVDVALRLLSERDLEAFQARVAPDAWRATRAVLAHLMGFADGSGVVAEPVQLSHKTLLLVCGDRRIATADGRRRRAYLVALEELQRLGVLTLHTNYSTGHHARRYSVWYRFGSGELPESGEGGELVLARREVTEGTLAIIAHGDGACEARLEPGPGIEPAGPDARDSADAPSGRGWWRRMFAARVFTVAEVLGADERRVIPGPWTWRRRGPRRSAPTSPPQPANDQQAPLARPEPPRVVPDRLEAAIERAWEAFERRERGELARKSPPHHHEPLDRTLNSAIERAWEAFAKHIAATDSS